MKKIKIFSYISLLKKYNTLQNEYETLEKKYAIAISEVDSLTNTNKALKKQIKEFKKVNKPKAIIKKEVRNERG